MVTIKQTSLFTVIKLSPNQSASWRETKIVISIMVLLVISIAIGWTMAGAWIILPFAGLEVGLFAYFMYRICRQGFAQQIITITADQVLIESGIQRREVARTYHRELLSFEIKETERDWHLPDIVLCLDNYRLSILIRMTAYYLKMRYKIQHCLYPAHTGGKSLRVNDEDSLKFTKEEFIGRDLTFY